MDASIQSVNRSTFEERHKNLLYLRSFYGLLHLILVVAVIWASFVVGYRDPFGNGIKNIWWLALITGIVCVLCILAAFFIAAVKKPMANWIVYIVFLLCFMYTYGYFCAVDEGYLAYYSLWLLTIITGGLCVYAW